MKPKFLGIRPLELAIMAIYNLGDKFGSTEEEIIRFVSEKYGLEERRAEPVVRSALKRGLDFGILSMKNGRFGLENVPEPPSGMDSEGSSEQLPGSMRRKRERQQDLSDAIERGILQWKKERDEWREGSDAKRMRRGSRTDRPETDCNKHRKGKRKPRKGGSSTSRLGGRKKKSSGRKKSSRSNRAAKQCPEICPKACPRSIERCKQGHSKEALKGKFGGLSPSRVDSSKAIPSCHPCHMIGLTMSEMYPEDYFQFSFLGPQMQYDSLEKSKDLRDRDVGTASRVSGPTGGYGSDDLLDHRLQESPFIRQQHQKCRTSGGVDIVDNASLTRVSYRFEPASIPCIHN
ncbi:UNVERIFIED_CONTAM: hypothetical protein PYX00_009348 [Menopon gallinae]|uniref:H15 domain-containing protein n=1 Tax=Menopon gallinae TaxID=328185 RepID=A0AAW2HAX0_9NEOP